MFSDHVRYLRRDVFTTLRDPTDHAQHLCFWRVLQNIGGRPRIERTAYAHILYRSSHHHHDRSRAFLPDRNKRICTARARKPLIHNRHVWPDATKLGKSILGVLRLTDKEQIRLRLDDHTQPFPKKRVVIDQEYPYGFRWLHFVPPTYDLAASSSSSGKEWTNDEFKAKDGKEDQEPAPKGCSTYALTDYCSDPHTQQRGNDRECGQSNISKMESSATSQDRRERNC